MWNRKLKTSRLYEVYYAFTASVLITQCKTVWQGTSRILSSVVKTHCAPGTLWTAVQDSMGCTRNPIHLLSADTTKPQDLPVIRSWYSSTDAKSWTNRALSTHVCSILSCIHSSTSNLTNSPQSIRSLLLKLAKCNPFSIPLTPVAKHNWHETGRRVTHYLRITSRPSMFVCQQ